MKTKVFAEIGIGNKSFLSTEFEKGKKEFRVKGFIRPNKINGFYFRFWIFKKVLIISTCNGITMNNKPKNNLKILFGVEGVN